MHNDFSTVQTIYILHSGEQVTTLAGFESVKDRFDWVDKKILLSEMLHVRGMTNKTSKSIIAIFEEGKTIKSFINLAPDFHLKDLVVDSE
jgi:hypothetical protein